MGRPTNNVRTLKLTMKRYSLTRPQVAKHLCVNLSTVDRWLTPSGNTSYRRMPDMAVKLMAYIENAGDFGERTDGN